MNLDKEPLVSVVVPLYNYEKYISDCIRSILTQDYERYELIVVDDVSTDKSFKKANRFTDSRVKVLRLAENSGYSKAKNEGIIASRGQLIATLDADDMFTKISISCRVQALLQSKADFVHADAISVKGSITLDQCYELTKFRRECPRIHAQTVMVCRDIYKKFGLYDENLRSRSDKEMWWRLLGLGHAPDEKVRRVFVKKDVAYYRKHAASMMVKRRKNKKYNEKVTRRLKDAYEMRLKGITHANTRFLEE